MANFLQTIGNTLAQIAPTAAGMFLSPIGATAVAGIEKVLGITPAADSTLEQRAGAIQSMVTAGLSPEQLVAMKQADDAFKTQLVNAGITLAQTDAADRASARQMAATTKDSTPRVLTYLILLACTGMAAVIVLDLSPAVKNPVAGMTVGTIVGYLFSELKAACAYWFGSSSGSDAKNALLNKALDSTPPESKT
jgi:hypothetical protein